jgi:hypothetical protein
MRATVLNGARDETLDRICAAIEDLLAGDDWRVDAFTLRDLDIAPCVGCFGCWVRTPGVCIIDDAAREIAQAFIQSDLVVFFTPVTFGGYSAQLKKALDRNICLISPFFEWVDGEIHHRARYARYPYLLGVGVLPEPDTEDAALFATLIERNAINMHAPSYAACTLTAEQGGEEIERVVRLQLTEMGVER